MELLKVKHTASLTAAPNSHFTVLRALRTGCEFKHLGMMTQVTFSLHIHPGVSSHYLIAHITEEGFFEEGMRYSWAGFGK